MALISIADAESLAARALQRAGASAAAAQATARALVYAEAQGTVSHGLSRVPQYAGHMGAGRWTATPWLRCAASTVRR